MLNSFLVLILSCLILAPASQANEGFIHDPTNMPPIFQELSQRVFMVYSSKDRRPIGTAFLVFNDGKSSVFITARHVLYSLHPRQLKENLTRLSLHQSAYWQSGVHSFLRSEYSVSPTEMGALQDSTPDWKLSGRASDVGYFIADSHPNMPLLSLETTLGHSIKHDASPYQKRKNYILGYPALEHRDEAGSRIQSMQISLSQGDIFHFENKNKKFIVHSTADSRGGNSGGPVYSETGQLLGVLSGGPMAKGYVPYKNDMNSAIAPVDYVRSMIGHLLLGRKTNMASSKMCHWFYQIGSRPNRPIK